jgi:hypothetical protein
MKIAITKFIKFTLCCLTGYALFLCITVPFMSHNSSNDPLGIQCYFIAVVVISLYIVYD